MWQAFHTFTKCYPHKHINIATCQQNCSHASRQLLLPLRISYTIQFLLQPYTLAAILLSYLYCPSAISIIPFTSAKQICSYANG